jgi:hypothetical protein
LRFISRNTDAITTTITTTIIVAITAGLTPTLAGGSCVFVGVAVGVEVIVAVGVGVAVGVVVGFTVVVGVGVGDIGVGEGVGDGVGEGVGVGVAGRTQFHVMLDGAVIAKEIADVSPVVGTLPVPVQPEHVYPEDGDETNAAILVLLSYHALVGEGESYCDVTVK